MIEKKELKAHFLQKMQRKKCKLSRQSKTLAEAREREMMMKEAREIKDKMINDAKEEAQAEGVK
jgi:hypothetical protein